MYLWMWIEKDFGGVVTVRRDCWVEGVGGHWFKNVYPEREFQKSLPCAAMLKSATPNSLCVVLNLRLIWSCTETDDTSK